MTGPSTITITRSAPRVMAGPRKAPFTAWVVPGRDGQGINYTDSVATYADLPTDLDADDRGKGYFVVDDGLLYNWNGATFPAQGDGLPIQGEVGPQGRGIQAGGVSVVGTQLRFLMNDGSTDAVTIPAIQQAIDSAAAASSSATTAGTARDAAQAAAQTAGTAATTAVGARDAAQTARTAAEAARDTATTAATGADNSADAAATSAAAADVSETNAANSAGASATSATQADASADSADAARSAAVAAQAAAEGSATTAGVSAAAAASSADDAGDSAAAAAASAAEAADVVTSGVPNATATDKGGIRLTGDLGGTWDNPTVPGLANKADLDENGKVLISQIPAQALIERRLVATTAERLALTDVQPGDVAIQSGNPGRGSYILAGADPSLESSWTMFLLPDSPVQSVNGYVGIVVLGKADVGLGNVDNTSDANKPVSGPQQTALDAKLAKRTGTNLLYSNGADGNPAGINYTSNATNFTAAFRDGAGTFKVGTPTDVAHPTTKNYVDTALGGKAAAVHTHAAGDLTSGTLDIARLPVGTAATQVAAGNDSRIVNAVPNTRQVIAGTGLSGGGALSADRTLAVAYGNTAGTAAQGNDARLSDQRVPTDLSVITGKLADASVTIPKLGADVVPGIQGMIDASIGAAQRITVNAQTGAYALVLADANKAVEVSSATAVNLTIPTDAAVAFPVGTVIEVDQLGAGKVTIVGASGVTVQAPVTPTTRAQFSAVVLRKRGANLWLVTGDM
ncbi:minor tail protein [Gordonia phage EMoore]|uniref:Minor tail protein n=1 Tax=Gordonia phage EMoore TaxID=2656534 RepID=A0A649VV60_9CAUD|nr:minor tail protein [Gordonia phage EMoore]QGJ95822.1 minor tail protein [Gordonia phage EMoore]